MSTASTTTKVSSVGPARIILRSFCNYLATGRARCGNVGRARSELVEAADLVNFGTAWMNARFAALVK